VTITQVGNTSRRPLWRRARQGKAAKPDASEVHAPEDTERHPARTARCGIAPTDSGAVITENRGAPLSGEGSICPTSDRQSGLNPLQRTPPTDSAGESLFAPGRNCWRVERAGQVAFLVDGEEYFGAVRAALAKAQHSFYILGWDTDSRMRLTPKGADDGLPEPLAEFLNTITARRGVHGYVLSWDFAMLYTLEREWFPIFKLDWRTHRRLHFRLDDHIPAGASHHQKIVVVDDTVAFVSGYDLTRVRWDTHKHAEDDPCRVDHRGVKYAPVPRRRHCGHGRLRPRPRRSRARALAARDGQHARSPRYVGARGRVADRGSTPC
jgi:hypothetical protein